MVRVWFFEFDIRCGAAEAMMRTSNPPHWDVGLTTVDIMYSSKFSASLLAVLVALLLSACGGGPPPPRHGPEDLAALETGTRLHPSLGTPIGFMRGTPPADPEARLVLYVHGTPGEKEGWADFLVEPVDGTRSLAIDRPGFGASASSGAVPDLMVQAQSVEPFLPEAGQRPAIVVGHSLGGPIAVAAAMRYPDRIAAVVILAGSLDPAQESVMFVQHMAAAGPLRWMLPDWLDVTNQELLPLKGQLEALAARIHELTQPVVILHGTEDDLVPYANVAYMENSFRWSRKIESITLIGANHFLPWMAEQETRRAIRKALALADAPQH